MAESGLHKAASENTSSGKGYCGACGQPKCICGAKPSEASPGAPSGNKTALDAAFGAVKDEHGGEMFKGLKQVGGK